MVAAEHSVNAFFILDILFNLHTGYVDPASRMLVRDVRLTRRHYLRGWFGADLIATVPFDAMLDSEKVHGGGYLVFTLLRLLRMLRLLRLTRITTRLQIRSGLQTSSQVEHSRYTRHAAVTRVACTSPSL